MDETMVISGHPNLEQAYTNKTILSRIETVVGINIRYLINMYLNYEIRIPEECEIDLNEGEYHIGRGSVVRFVGKKIR